MTERLLPILPDLERVGSLVTWRSASDRQVPATGCSLVHPASPNSCLALVESACEASEVWLVYNAEEAQNAVLSFSRL
jgi:hypothetical protein